MKPDSSQRCTAKGHKLQQGKLSLAVRKPFSSRSMVKPWNRFPSLEIFKTEMNKALNNLIWTLKLALLWAGVWTRWQPNIPYNLLFYDFNYFQFFSYDSMIVSRILQARWVLRAKSLSVTTTKWKGTPVLQITEKSSGLTVFHFTMHLRIPFQVYLVIKSL